jgi:hypothetical protein
MTASKLQEAIALIKSGDKPNGQRLLTEVLQTDPRNEIAWLWMAALMTGERRRLCLEKVLSLNPNHPQAREQLARLSAASAPPRAATPVPAAVAPRASVPPVQAAVAEPPAPRPSSFSPAALPSAPEPVRNVTGAPVREAQTPQVWVVPGKTATVVYMSGDVLLTFSVFPDSGPAVLAELSQGITAKELEQLKKKHALIGLKQVPLAKTKSVTVLDESLKIIWVDTAGNEKKVTCTTNKETSQGILNALRQRLGPGFQETTQPISRGRVVMSSVGLLAFVCVATSFFWWLVRGAQAELADGGSVRVRGFVALLMLIGPNGILCLGGGLTVLLIVAMILSLAKPPVETILARDPKSGKSI